MRRLPAGAGLRRLHRLLGDPGSLGTHFEPRSFHPQRYGPSGWSASGLPPALPLGAILPMFRQVVSHALYVAMKPEADARLCSGFPREKVGSPGRTRTSDPAVNSRLLYQLSYRGAERAHVKRRYDLVDSKRQEGFPELCANPRNWRPARRRRGLRRRRIALMSGIDPPRAQAPRWPTKSACSIATGTCRNRSRSASGSAFCSSPAACSASCPCSASG